MIKNLIAAVCGPAIPKGDELATAINLALERAILEAMSDERERCASIIQDYPPIIRPGENKIDLEATFRALATRIRLAI